MQLKRFNRAASPEDIERLRDYKKDLRAVQVEIYTVSYDMNNMGATDTLISKKKELFTKESKVKKLMNSLLIKYDCE